MDRESGQIERKTTKSEPEKTQARVYQEPSNLLPPLPNPDPITEVIELEPVTPPKFTALKKKQDKKKTEKIDLLEDNEKRYC